MAAVWIILISAFAYIITIALVVIGEDVHPLIAVVLFAVIVFGAYKLFTSRVTRI